MTKLLPRHVAHMRKMAAKLRKEGRGASHLLIGPALVYGDDELAAMVAVGNPGRPSRIVGATLGTFESDPKDDPLAAMADTVLWVRQWDGITKREGDAYRQELIRLLRRSFRHVEDCEDELALAEANARLFPSAEARRLLTDIRAEAAAE
jgi:hypothetical protein